MKRALIAVSVAGALACATSRTAAPSTRVRLIASPERTRVSLDCSGARKIDAVAPFEFDFPDGPDARCIADLSADHYKPALVYIDRQYLVENGEFPSRDVPPLPRINAGATTGLGAIIELIEVGVEHVAEAVAQASAATQPDVTLRISLKPESAS